MFPIVYFINKLFNVIWWTWSQCVNSWLWLTIYSGTWQKWSLIIDLYKTEINSIYDVRGYLKNFEWHEDRRIDWFPWEKTVFASRFHGDCDDAAVYGKFLLNCIGIKSRRVKLISINFNIWKFWGYYYHIIQVSNDNKYMVSNGELMEITSSNWKEFVKDYFGKNLDFYDFIL